MASNSALPALDIGQPFNALASVENADKFQDDQTLRPAILQAKENAFASQATDFGNSQLTQAASEALASDPEDAPRIWDQAMQKTPQGAQYVGHYRPDLAKKVLSVFGSSNGKGGSGSDDGSSAPVDPQMQARVAQLPPDQLAKSLGNMNMAIGKFQNVQNADDLQAEATALQQAGMPIGQLLPGVDFSKKDPLSFHQNYQAVAQALAKLEPVRNAMQQQAAQSALGVPAPPAPLIKVGKDDSFYDPVSKTWVQPPASPSSQPYELADPDKTGMAPGSFNKSTGQYNPLQPQGAPPAAGPAAGAAPAATSLAQKLITSESGGNASAQNPQPGQTSGGIGGMTNATYLTQARKLLPALKNVPDAQVLAMKKSGALNGLNTDLVMSQNQDDGAVLQKNGQPVTDTTKAIAYKLGAPDALKLLKASPDTPLSAILSPNVIKANSGQQFGANSFDKLTAGQYAANIHSQFEAPPQQQVQQPPAGTQYGKRTAPVMLEFTDKDGNSQQVLAQQNQVNHQWVTASNGQPLDFPNGDEKIVPPSTGGGRNAGMVTRSLTAAKDAAADIQNMVQLPLSANSGLFGMRGAHGDGTLMGSAWNILGNKLTTQEQQDMNTTMVGMGRALAGLETGGTQVQQALMNQYEKLAVQQGDTYATAMRKLGTMRQNAINGAEANMASPYTSADQKKQFQATIDAIKTAVPWTPSDVTAYERAAEKNSQMTFSDFAAQHRMGGGAPAHVPSPVIDGLKAGTLTLPNGQVLSGVALRNAIDQKYGAGSSAQILGAK